MVKVDQSSIDLMEDLEYRLLKQGKLVLDLFGKTVLVAKRCSLVVK